MHNNNNAFTLECVRLCFVLRLCKVWLCEGWVVVCALVVDVVVVVANEATLCATLELCWKHTHNQRPRRPVLANAT